MAGKPKSAVEIVWEAPPERNGASMYDEAIDQLKKSPGRWARIRVAETASGAYSARKSFMKRANDARFEGRVGKFDDDTQAVWVRYRTPEQMQEGRPPKAVP